ncbi:MAG: hypothetical protein ACI93R_003106 [Flavobacteriales bacterium]|jgi:hypothetical protein
MTYPHLNNANSKKVRKLTVSLSKSIALISLIGASSGVVGLDESRLWLPTYYEKLYLDLKDSALEAEKLDRCVNVLRGTIDLQQSTKGKPIFRIQCRQENGRTYNEMVDGLSKVTLTTVFIPDIPPSDEEIELQRLDRERKEREAHDLQMQVFHSICLVELKEKTKLFSALVFKSESIEPIAYEAGMAKFRFSFDAKDMDGRVLRYQASCQVSSDGVYRLKVRSRKN